MRRSLRHSMPWSRQPPTLALAAAIAASIALPTAIVAAHATSPRPSPAPSASPASGEQAMSLLRASILAPKSVSYVGQLETLRFSSSRSEATIVRVEHLAPDMTRRWYLAPEGLYGDYTVSRGIATYEYDTKHSRVVSSRNPAVDNQVAAVDNLGLVTRNYRAVLGGHETIANHKTESVSLINKYTGERAVRVWLDTSTNLVLKEEQYRGNGAVAAETRFEELRYTSSIPRDVFSVTVPSGYVRVTGRDYASPTTDVVKVVKSAGFQPVIPKYLPEGFTIFSADLATVSDVRTLHFLYSDGLRSLSLFENAIGAAADFGKLKPQTVSFEGHEAEYVEDGPTTLLTWQERGLHFALVSDLALHDLVDIAISVVP
jgi:outer membrane lipoprotein-sorting protein